MSEERHCRLCHTMVWFGAFGTSEDHVKFTEHDLVCTYCITKLMESPIIKRDDRITRNTNKELGESD